MHRIYVPGADGATVRLAADQSHHLTRVLRLGAGDAVVVFDGRGREWDGVVAVADRSSAVVALASARIPVPEPAVAVTLAVGVLSGDQMTDVVRDATALGVAAITPFISAHTTASDRRDWTGARDRGARVAVAAAMQSGRAVVPTIAPVQDLRTLVTPETGDWRVVCVEPARTVPGARPMAAETPTAATLFVGPEGGWSEGELTAFEAAGAAFIQLGARTLRAELAPTVALATLWATWGWDQGSVPHTATPTQPSSVASSTNRAPADARAASTSARSST